MLWSFWLIMSDFLSDRISFRDLQSYFHYFPSVKLSATLCLSLQNFDLMGQMTGILCKGSRQYSKRYPPVKSSNQNSSIYWLEAVKQKRAFPVNKRAFHCVKSVQIFSCIQSEYRKIRTRNNSVFGHFSNSVFHNFLSVFFWWNHDEI